jgi:hypothetical protein
MSRSAVHKRRFKAGVVAEHNKVESWGTKLSAWGSRRTARAFLLSDMDLLFLVDVAKKIDQATDKRDGR